ncbi:acyl-CoA thioesterase [Flavobacteriaceae bacterium F08102]|nr:acyl-CoA thioesterase [Flavobacteriaceae bacterium F08102]
MLTHEIQFRVRYAETDQMSFVYYGNYAQYFELGRVEWLRKLGLSYKTMEESGIMLPVVNLNINYHKPAKYDDLLRLETTLVKLPTVKIVFDYKLYNEANELLTTAQTTLVFVNIETNKPTKAPVELLTKLENAF